jgi:hypothetical protein
MGKFGAKGQFPFCGLLLVVFCCGADGLEAQTIEDNAWTNAVSGNWQDAYWSLGTLPGTNQDIYITNAGWKALAIGPGTVQNYPQTLTVNSITVSSPTNSFNVLLLNYAGYQTPFMANSITLNSNTVMTILASVVNVTNMGGSRLEVGGTVNQGEFPAVNASVLSLGNIGPGIYNLTNGTLTVVTGYVGGAFAAQFNQYGGYNSVSTLRIVGTNELYGQVGAGEYDLYDGTLGGSVELHHGGLLKQSGGTFVGSVWFDGTYELDGGLFTSANLAIPTTDQGDPTKNTGLAGEVLQTGGTNQTGPVYLGGEASGDLLYYFPVPGAYVLSNGLLVATSTFLDVGGNVTQTGGTFTNSGQLTVAANLLHSDYGLAFYCGQYDLQGGFLAENSIVTSGYFTQSGGTNQVAGTTRISSIPTEGEEQAQYTISGGLFATAGVTLSNAVISQSGGSLVTGNLGLSVNLAPPFYGNPLHGYDLSGGQLTVSGIQLSGYAVFRHRGGTLLEPGLLTLAGGLWDEQTSGQQFGPLQVSSAFNVTNSMISLPTNGCILRFADSSGVAWTGAVTLIITNWAGSTQGGGPHQVIFGSNSSGLTAAQLSDVFFANPAGFPEGLYPARILSTGEIVPHAAPAPAISAPMRLANGGLSLGISGETGFVYGVNVSTDLLHWSFWTNQNNANGTITFVDTAATNFPHRFYRAFVQP